MATVDPVVRTDGPDPDDTAALEAGLDALETSVVKADPWWRRLLRKVVPPLVAVGLVLLIWQLAYLAEVKESFLLPSPAMVWEELQSQWQSGALQQAIVNSLRRGLGGFALAILIAVPLGVVVARVPVIRAAIGPILSALQTLPSIAWVPAAIIWFGVTNEAIIAVILLGAVPSIANGLVSGFDQTPRIYGRVGTMLGARGWRMIWHVRLPAAMPGFIAGLRQGWAFAWRSLMAAELIAFSPELGLGLGQLLDQGRELFSMTIVLGLIITILVVGLVIELLLFGPIERRVLKVRGLGDQR